jgi:hypothetical protein
MNGLLLTSMPTNMVHVMYLTSIHLDGFSTANRRSRAAELVWRALTMRILQPAHQLWELRSRQRINLKLIDAAQ